MGYDFWVLLHHTQYGNEYETEWQDKYEIKYHDDDEYECYYR